jgi:hypothetical protein
LGLFVAQTDPSSPCYAATSRGWSRGIRPVSIHVPSAVFGVNSNWGAHAPRVRFDATPCRMSFPNVRDEASRTTREARVLPISPASWNNSIPTTPTNNIRAERVS